MKYSQKNQSEKNKKLLVATTVLVLVLVASGFLLYLKNRDQSANVAPLETNQPGAEKIDLSPPTDEEKQTVDQNKEEIIRRQQEEQNIPPQVDGKQQVKPVITYAGQYGQQIEVGGYIPGIFEDGGICTATLKQGQLQLTKEVSSVKGANSVDCPVMAFQRSEFGNAGTWQVTVTYSSAKAAGTSDDRALEVQ